MQNCFHGVLQIDTNEDASITVYMYKCVRETLKSNKGRFLQSLSTFPSNGNYYSFSGKTIQNSCKTPTILVQTSHSGLLINYI